MFCHPEKSYLYKDKFHPIIQQRISSQITYDYMSVASDSLADLILDFAVWDDTIEKGSFWNDIYELYRKGNVPTEEELLAVFEIHKIKP